MSSVYLQGPLDSTNGDFWRMVWQENVDTVLMLCRVNEAGKVKCSQYWPKSIGETKSFYGITIKNDGVSFYCVNTFPSEMLNDRDMSIASF